MQARRFKGFTLVEILIVVVILGILAAIVVPQFTSASTQAVKSALQTQLQTVSSQVELYRVRNSGAYPDADAANAMFGASNNGWGILVTSVATPSDYLKSVPMNGYTGSSVVIIGDQAAAFAGTRTSAFGWTYDTTVGATQGQVNAAGFKPVANLLAHEVGYAAAVN